MINLFYPYPRFDECCFYPISNEFYPYFMKNEFTHILRSTSFTRSLGNTNPIVCLLLYPTYCIPSIFTVKLCWHNETSVYDSISPRIAFFQSARSGPDWPQWINLFDWLDCRPELLEKVLKTVADQKPSSRGRPRIWWGRVRTLRQHSTRPSVESGRGYRKLQRAA